DSEACPKIQHRLLATAVHSYTFHRHTIVRRIKVAILPGVNCNHRIEVAAKHELGCSNLPRVRAKPPSANTSVSSNLKSPDFKPHQQGYLFRCDLRSIGYTPRWAWNDLIFAVSPA